MADIIESDGERGEILAEFINASTEELYFLRACLVQQRTYQLRANAQRALTLAAEAFELALARTVAARDKCQQ